MPLERFVIRLVLATHLWGARKLSAFEARHGFLRGGLLRFRRLPRLALYGLELGLDSGVLWSATFVWR